MIWLQLRATKQKFNKKKIFGFDIETYNNNKNFYCASIVGDNYKQVFMDKRSLIKAFKQKKFKNSYVAATNLQFDFNGTFYGQPEAMQFFTLFRGSDLLFARSYIENKEFKVKRTKSNSMPICFIDILNYAKLSVEKAGKILNIPKIESPEFLGRKPKTKDEKQELINYNIRDSQISKRFVEFLFATFQQMGANPKLTIASTSMSLYKNKYLGNKVYWRHDTGSLLEQFKAYYGGRTEAFCRGKFRNYNYYDVNSLYPDVMRNEFPNPNSRRITTKNSIKYIDSFEGISHVEVSCPAMEYPLLPFRYEKGAMKKLLFATGTFSGWYSHVELREAIELGYTIKKVHKTIYFKETCLPFRDFVETMYDIRKEYEKEKSPMEYVVKILMNSLYGKFGQKFIDRDNWQPMNLTKQELDKLKDFEIIGDYIRIKKAFVEPPAFTIPIWALYVTAYARLKLYKLIKRHKPIYCDTDSIITRKEIITSKELGGLKKEYHIKEGVIIKPKFYFIKPSGKEKDFVKAKGIGFRLTKEMFFALLKEDIRTFDKDIKVGKSSVAYKKFVKFKESIRRGFIPNEIISMEKHLNLNDDKRIWDESFNPDDFQFSKPLMLRGGKIVETKTDGIKEYEALITQ